MLTPKVRRNSLRIIPFGVLWLVFSIVYTLLEKGLLGNLKYYPSTGNPYDFARNIFTTPSLALITGLLMGVLEILYFSKWFIKKSFSKKIVYKSLIYLVIILLFLILTFIATSKGMPAAVMRKDFWSSVLKFLTGYSVLSVTIYITSIIVVIQFYTEVSESIGPGILNHFFMGKYHRPVEEERMFMFLDMKSSTTIAEEMGHIRYFSMLKEYFSDLSEAVINYAGEIYQYAGDEIIVSWRIREGLENNNCLQCFFVMKDSIQQEAKKYHDNFGVLPKFKAGLHCGKVTTGEIGVLKKEIIFTGDVLNTTARIQGLCNSHNVDILISDPLLKQLKLYPEFQAKSMGENELKGKGEKITLFTIIKLSGGKNTHKFM